MPPSLASFLTAAVILYLFRRDIHEKPNVTGALWLPVIWILIIGSRFVSQWLDAFGLKVGGGALEEGSPIDALVFLILISSGIYVVGKRHVKLGEVVRNNRWLAFYLLYCFLAILWSDFPVVAFKRWFKMMGHPIMALVLLTEPDPEEAVTSLMKRCAYVLIPTSILFIKYIPELGRGFDSWSGVPINTGVTTNKNMLGSTCLVCGIFFAWQFLKTFRKGKGAVWRNEILLNTGLLVMIVWLFSMANSQTSLISLLVGVVTMVLLGLRRVDKRYIGTYVIAVIVGVVAVEQAFGAYEGVLKLLGRDPTLTDRTEVWHDVLSIDINPVLGAGFESFWLGDRLKILWEKWPWQPNQAHNGYIETYINLGLIGLIMLTGLIISTFRKIRLELLRNLRWGQFRLGFLFAALAYNYTEAAFKALHIVWFAFYIIALDYPERRNRQPVRSPRKKHTEYEPTIAPVSASA